MMFSFSRMSLFLAAALSLGQSWAEPVAATDRSTFDYGWKFARFGKMPDGSTKEEPGKALGIAKATSSEDGNPADNAVDGDMGTRWCAADGKSGNQLMFDMGRPVAFDRLEITWEKKNSHQFKVEGSTDGKSWKVLEDKSTQGTNEASDTISAKDKCRQFRITVTGNNGGNWASIREVQVFEGDKEIRPEVKGGASSPSAPKFNDAQWRSLNLPHDWGIEGPFRMELENETGKLPWPGIGWYRKSFTLPTEVKGNRFYLDFDGVMSRPTIYVNGQKAGEWKYGYASFRVDITPYVKAGAKNSVAVRVDNPPNSSRWYPGGGIYRHVWLTTSNPVHIDNWGVFVRTPKIDKTEAEVAVTTSVVNTTKGAVTPTVKEEVLSAKGKVVSTVTTKGESIAPGETGNIDSQLMVKKPKLWGPKSPYLYTLRTTVSLGDAIVDVKETTFGIRTVEWKPEGFFLNGEKIKLYGVCQHHDLGPLGGAVHARGYERQVEILKSMGCNSIRTSHNPPAPEMLEACDRAGIIVLDEMFDMWQHAKKGQDYHNYFKDWHERDVVNFVHRDRNHPSVVLWSLGNEVPEQGIKESHHIAKDLSDIFHREDPTRLTTCGCNNEGAARNGFADGYDIHGFNYKPWAYKKYHQDFPNRAFYASETASCVSSRGEYFFDDSNPKEPVSWQKGKGAYMYQVSSYDLYAPGWAYRPDVEFAAQDDCDEVAGEYVWTGFDYMGEPTPYNLDATNALNVPAGPEREKLMAELKKLGDKAPSRSSYFGIVDLCGFPKDRFYIYQAQWNPNVKMAHILPHWTWPDRKGKVTPVHVYSSGDEAELFLNGKSLGVKKKGMGEKDRYRFVWDDVVYEPGTLKVVVKKDGKVWAEDSVSTAGSPAKLKVTADRKEILGDGRDLSYVKIEVKDAKGHMVPQAKDQLYFKIDGPAEIVAVCNGDATDFDSFQKPAIKAYNGLAQVIVRSKRGEEGEVKLLVTSKNKSIKPVGLKLNVTKATPEQLKK